MADDFTILDHIAPYVPCLGRFRRSRIFLLPSPPASTSNLLDTTARRDPDLLSLHSNIGRGSTCADAVDSAGSLSRWQLLQSWWTTSAGDRQKRGQQQPLYLGEDDSGDADAQELLMPVSPSRKASSPRRIRSSRPVDAHVQESPRPKLSKQRSSSRYSDSAYTASSEETSNSGSRKHKKGKRSSKKRTSQRAYSDYTESTIDEEEDAGSQSTAPTSVGQDELEDSKDALQQ
jgi:hypothetical protein